MTTSDELASDALGIRALRALLADRRFIELHEVLVKPSLLTVLGQTFTERWHSAFFAWLLHPGGPHGLGAFALRRLLVWMHSPNEEGEPRCEHPVEVAAPPPGEEFLHADLDVLVVRPSAETRETSGEFRLDFPEEGGSKRKHGFIDVFVLAKAQAEGKPWLHALVVEVKVKASEGVQQTGDYETWATSQKAEYVNTRARAYVEDLDAPEGLDHRASLLFLAPARNKPSSRGFVAMTFQEYVDELLLPCTEHPHITAEGRTLLDAYLHNLATPFADAMADRLAVSPFEAARVDGLIEDHREGVDALEAGLRAKRQEEKTGKSITLTDLVRAGRLATGTALRYRKGRTERDVRLAEIPEHPGRFGISVAGKVYGSPTAAAAALYGAKYGGSWGNFAVVGPEGTETVLASIRGDLSTEELVALTRAAGPSLQNFAEGAFRAHGETFRLISTVLERRNYEALDLPGTGLKERGRNVDWLAVLREEADANGRVELEFLDDSRLRVVVDTHAKPARAFVVPERGRMSGNQATFWAWSQTWPERAAQSPNRQFQWARWWRLVRGERAGRVVRGL